MSLRNARAALKSYKIKPNKVERELREFLNLYLPGEFTYNGGQVIIEGKVPDFFCIKNQKALIELVSERYHDEDELEDREELFSKYGFKTLMVYDYELKNEEELFNKILFWLYEGVK